jgi:hypothetical protein
MRKRKERREQSAQIEAGGCVCVLPRVKVIACPDCVGACLLGKRNEFKIDVRMIKFHAAVVPDSQLDSPDPPETNIPRI